MVEVGTKFSLINKKTMLTVALFSIIWVVCLVATVKVITDFSEVIRTVTKESVYFYALTVLSFPGLTISMLTFPIHYVTVTNGIMKESLVRSRTVSFADVERLLIETVAFPRLFARAVPMERIVLSANAKRMFVVSWVNDFDELRDHILESVDDSIVVDEREGSKVG